MRIAIFSDTFLPQLNGVAYVAYNSALALGELGHKVCIFTVSDGCKNVLKDITQGKFDIITLPSIGVSFYPDIRATLPLGLTLRKVKKFSPDIIHSHTPFPVGWEGVMAAKLFRIPLVGTHHTFFDHYLKHIKMDYEWAKKSSWKYINAYYNRCNLVLSPSNSLANELKSHGLKRPIEILPNSIDTEFFKPIANEAAKNKLKSKFGIKGKSLVYEGRISYEKSINQVVEAFKIVVQKMPEVKLMIAGDGPEKSNLVKQVKNLGLEGSVIFIGFRHNQESIDALRANDVFLTASKSENMPLSVLQAMAVGLPVIAANALGLPEIVRDNENGLLVSPDNPKEMAEKILKLIKDEKLLKKFSRASRELALNYSQEKIAESLFNMYQNLIDKKQ